MYAEGVAYCANDAERNTYVEKTGAWHQERPLRKMKKAQRVQEDNVT